MPTDYPGFTTPIETDTWIATTHHGRRIRVKAKNMKEAKQKAAQGGFRIKSVEIDRGQY